MRCTNLMQRPTTECSKNLVQVGTPSLEGIVVEGSVCNVCDTSHSWSVLDWGKKKDNKTLCFCFHTDCYNAHTVVSKGHDVTDLILMKADSWFLFIYLFIFGLRWPLMSSLSRSLFDCWAFWILFSFLLTLVCSESHNWQQVTYFVMLTCFAFRGEWPECCHVNMDSAQHKNLVYWHSTRCFPVSVKLYVV